MDSKPMSIVQVLIFAAGGALLGVVAMVLQLLLGSESPVKRFLAFSEWPWDHTITWYARVFRNGNTDQAIPEALVLWGIYWITLGAALGLAGYGVWRCFAPRG
jgi:hypothetical protein